MNPARSANDSSARAFPTRPRPWTAASLNDPVFLLGKIGNRATKLYAEALRPLDLRPRHIAALRFIADREGASQRELVDGLWSDSSSVVTLLDEFEERGLAERRRNTKDRRAYAVYLTPQGFQVLHDALELSGQVQDAIMEPLGQADRERLLELLVQIVGG